METSRSAFPITDADLDALKDRAEKQISKIGGYDLEDILKKLPPEETYRVAPIDLELVYVIRRGVSLYVWFADWLFNKTGQKAEAANSSGPTESIMNKQKFSSAYSLFVMANYIMLECKRLLEGKDSTQLATGHPNFKLEVGRNFTNDLQIALAYYVETLQSDDGNGVKLVKCANDTVSISRDYWQTVADKALAIAKAIDPAIQATILNTTFTYNDFTVAAYTIDQKEETTSSSFVPVQPDEVVGNTEAVIMLLRLCDRIALYDAVSKKNPMCEIGGLYESNLLDGPPGTGKTSLQRMAMTRLALRAGQVHLPFLFKSLEAKDIKSEWYGKSGKMLADLIQSVLNPKTLALLLVDDIDLLLSNRDDPGAGGADKDLLKGLMDFFSGIGTNYKGNYSSIAATNKPTGVDDALRQRFVYRVMVTGAETWEDYADLVALQLKKAMKYGLVQINDNGYTPLSRTRPKLLLDHKKMYNKSGSWADIGHAIQELNKKDSSFTARSVKNATDIVVAKAGDFEVPEEWFTIPSLFQQAKWETKISMIRELFGVISTDSIIDSINSQYESEVRYNENKYVNKN